MTHKYGFLSASHKIYDQTLTLSMTKIRNLQR